MNKKLMIGLGALGTTAVALTVPLSISTLQANLDKGLEIETSNQLFNLDNAMSLKFHITNDKGEERDLGDYVPPTDPGKKGTVDGKPWDEWLEKYRLDNNVVPYMTIKKGIFSFHNRYLTAVNPDDWYSFATWFIGDHTEDGEGYKSGHQVYGAEGASLSTFEVVRGAEVKGGGTVTLGGYSNPKKETPSIKIYPDGFFGFFTVFSTFVGSSERRLTTPIFWDDASYKMETNIVDGVDENLHYQRAMDTSKLGSSPYNRNMTLEEVKESIELLNIMNRIKPEDEEYGINGSKTIRPYYIEPTSIEIINGERVQMYRILSEHFYDDVSDKTFLEMVGESFPHLLTDVSGPHLVKDDNGEYSVEEGDYKTFIASDTIGLAEIMHSISDDFSGFGVDFLKYVTIHEYGHFFTLMKASDLSEGGVQAAGISPKAPLSVESLYNIDVLNSYLSARSNGLQLERVDAFGNLVSDESESIYTRFTHNGTLEDYANILPVDEGGIYDSSNTSTRGNQVSLSELKNNYVDQNNTTLFNAFLQNAFDDISATISPGIKMNPTGPNSTDLPNNNSFYNNSTKTWATINETFTNIKTYDLSGNTIPLIETASDLATADFKISFDGGNTEFGYNLLPLINEVRDKQGNELIGDNHVEKLAILNKYLQGVATELQGISWATTGYESWVSGFDETLVDVNAPIRSALESGDRPYNDDLSGLFSNYTYLFSEALTRDFVQITNIVEDTNLSNTNPFLAFSQADTSFEYFIDGSLTDKYSTDDDSNYMSSATSRTQIDMWEETISIKGEDEEIKINIIPSEENYVLKDGENLLPVSVYKHVSNGEFDITDMTMIIPNSDDLVSYLSNWELAYVAGVNDIAPQFADGWYEFPPGSFPVNSGAKFDGWGANVEYDGIIYQIPEIPSELTDLNWIQIIQSEDDFVVGGDTGLDTTNGEWHFAEYEVGKASSWYIDPEFVKDNNLSEFQIQLLKTTFDVRHALNETWGSIYGHTASLSNPVLGKTRWLSNGFEKDRVLRTTLGWELYNDDGSAKQVTSADNITITNPAGDKGATTHAEAMWYFLLEMQGIGNRTVSGIFRNSTIDQIYMHGYVEKEYEDQIKYLKFTNKDNKKTTYIKLHVGDGTSNLYYLTEQGQADSKHTLEDEGYVSWISDYAIFGQFANSEVSTGSFTVEFADEDKKVIEGLFTMGDREYIAENGKYYQQAAEYFENIDGESVLQIAKHLN